MTWWNKRAALTLTKPPVDFMLDALDNKALGKPPKTTKPRPDFSFERQYDGHVFGCDEVGRAPLAGPVVAAAVHIPPEYYDLPLWDHVNDSKKISKKKRETLFEHIQTHCHWGIAESSPREVESINIVQASFLAMERALMSAFDSKNSELTSTLALIDGHIKPRSFPCATQTIVKGDSKSVSIAAASILAKVYRDRLMAKLARAHPYYGWERNAGYPTKEHLSAIETHGVTDHHRTTFGPVKAYLDKYA